MADRVSSLLRSVSRANVIGAALQKALALLCRKKMSRYKYKLGVLWLD
jgi:hypothetical protein